MDNSPAAAQAGPSLQWRDGLDGLRSTVAELHAHRAFLKADPTARLIGGNRPIRDHELFENKYWANTKTAWPHGQTRQMLGFSSVRWEKARDPLNPKYQLDLIALVPIQASHLKFRDTGPNRVEIEWDCDRFWIVPASVLHSSSGPDGKSRARSVVRLAVLAPYVVDTDHPLTSQKLTAILGENEPAERPPTEQPSPA